MLLKVFILPLFFFLNSQPQINTYKMVHILNLNHAASFVIRYIYSLYEGLRQGHLDPENEIPVFYGAYPLVHSFTFKHAYFNFFKRTWCRIVWSVQDLSHASSV